MGLTGFADRCWGLSQLVIFFNIHIGNKYKLGDTWIFTLKNPVEAPPRQYFLFNQNAEGIFCSAHYGPVFGGGFRDICVADNSNNNFSSYVNFPSSFSDTTARARKTFTGSENFKTTEIEVYLIQ